MKELGVVCNVCGARELSSVITAHKPLRCWARCWAHDKVKI